jgi:ArsR family transcriptional regulator
MTETLTAIACCAPLAAPALSRDEAVATAKLFQALGDPHRVRIVNLLATRRELLFEDEFVESLGLAQSTVSHHLKKLAEAGLLDRAERGKWVYFSLNCDALRTLAAVADMKGVCC